MNKGLINTTAFFIQYELRFNNGTAVFIQYENN